MDHLILSYEEQKFITKHQTLLESTFHVRISLPDGVNTPTHKHDRIVANVQGKHEKIHELKKFIEKKMEVQKQKHEQRITVKSNVPVITLSDSSDSDSLNNVIFQNQQKAKKRKQMKVSSETPANCSSNKIKLLGDLVVPVTSGNLSNSNESVLWDFLKIIFVYDLIF
ncbi:hypothetical protein TNIN_11851 [Trichonephila inaurata madagascariensis]|uniref:Uncharacterized protein n=1 Tax=Trichonephila inaurata madagascariensis TaxID=2747483 RepID=A0A8X6XUQ0_9ARAC|nr:hypothetical protein TNIN_11851 [Trichonephila inaurata madagascariensis]